MNNTPTPGQGRRAMDMLFGDVKTKSDRVILRANQWSLMIMLGSGILTPIANGSNKTLGQITIGFVVAAVLTFFTTFVILGIKTTGQSGGKKTFAGQAVYMFRNIFLYIFLPCIILTAILVIWAVITKQPAFR